MKAEDLDPLSSDILLETATIAWRELQYFFAAGKAIYVDNRLDLVEVAREIAADNSARVQAWLDAGTVGPVADELARHWYEADVTVWAVVIKPWVLVQEQVVHA